MKVLRSVQPLSLGDHSLVAPFDKVAFGVPVQ
jgi:hypothetical protein